MTIHQRPVPAEDFTGYLRSYNADAFDAPESVEEVWDHYHTKDGTHTVNGRVWERAKLLKDLKTWRKNSVPYELYIHEVIADGGSVAARYTVSSTMVWKVQTTTEVAVFYELADDGRVHSSSCFSWSRPGLSGPGGDAPWDSQARATGSVAPPPADGAEPTPAQDPAHYLRRYAELGYDPAVEATEAHDRFHTPDALLYVGGNVVQRSGAVRALLEAREKGHTWVPDIQETLREGDRFAARYTTAPDAAKPESKRMEVFAFGQFAEDGRVRLVRSLPRPGHGAR